ncbi:hypothetical protein [Geothrix campi]|uniref:hypothetical protein n=1 Tax=Geothrix campi TaxID=2966450 RepID=UPI002148AEE2|nr:hypothetical protein [Geothrix sp. SG10]
MRLRWMGLFLLAALLPAQDFGRLPEWAAQVARATAGETAPENAVAWVLLDRTEIAYTGSGEIRQRRFRLVKVLGERGLRQGTFVIHGLGGKGNKVKKLKGWNLRPDGDLVKLDSDDVVTMNDASEAEFSTDTITGAALDRVVKGSYIAFESLEAIQSPIGPVAATGLLETIPVRRWELDVAKKEGWFTNLQQVDVRIDRRHFLPWIAKVEPLGATGLAVSNLPVLPEDEGGHPHRYNVLPVVRVRFLDPAFPTARMWGTWDEVARWTAGNYASATASAGMADLHGRKGPEGLNALWSWMAAALNYKQVYLSAERGWVPEQTVEVGRKRYGDCKDLSAFFIAEARTLGFTAHPTLARINEGEIETQEEPFPVFNHVITALRLDKSLGLPGEVESPKGRFLLVDATDPFTPFGFLGSGHRGRRVMICLPDGAQWVTVPDAAILRDRLSVDLEGEVDGSALRATLKLKETGTYWNLRAIAHKGGAKAMREALMGGRFDLPATAQIEVVRLGDPLATDRPFEVEVKITHPDGFHRNGAEWNLAAWGIPYPPALIQKAGTPRRYPVASLATGELSYHATLTLPAKVKPVLPERKGDTPFRTFEWKAETEPAAGGTRLRLSLAHCYKPVTFGFEQLDKGLQAWKQDRGLVKTLREDGLAFMAVAN